MVMKARIKIQLARLSLFCLHNLKFSFDSTLKIHLPQEQYRVFSGESLFSQTYNRPKYKINYYTQIERAPVFNARQFIKRQAVTAAAAAPTFISASNFSCNFLNALPCADKGAIS